MGERDGYVIVMQLKVIKSRRMCLGIQGGQRGVFSFHLSFRGEGEEDNEVGGWWRDRKEQTVCSTAELSVAISSPAS